MTSYDVVIVGGGPGGYVAAIRAGQLGLHTALVEREQIGGVCLNRGCIPTKALLRNAEVLTLIQRAKGFGITVEGVEADYGQAVDRSRRVVKRLTTGVQALLKKNGVEVIFGSARLRDSTTLVVEPDARLLTGQHIILASGSRPRTLPGVTVDGQRIMTYREAIVDRSVPRSVVIVGAGPIGMEFAEVYHAYGSEVTVVEMLPHLLPLEDEEVSQTMERVCRRKGLGFRTGARVETITETEDGLSLRLGDGEQLLAERVLIAIGVRPNSEDLGLESVGVATERGFIPVDEQMRTNVPSIYAIGDVTGKLPLAHVAMAQGVTAAEAIAGESPPALNYNALPRCTYTSPQVASMGLSETQAKEQGFDVKIGKFPYRANGKALALDDYEGFVKIVSDGRYGEILGVHMIGPEVTELLPEFGLAMAMEATPEEIARVVHAHPTLSETLMEAALAVNGAAIHI
jgi:dihydrolipoamide dehydrogenase